MAAVGRPVGLFRPRELPPLGRRCAVPLDGGTWERAVTGDGPQPTADPDLDGRVNGVQVSAGSFTVVDLKITP